MKIDINRRIRTLLLWAVCTVCVLLPVIAGAAGDSAARVGTPKELYAALEDPSVGSIVFKNTVETLKTEKSLSVTKPVDLNGKIWRVSAGTVSLGASVSNGTLSVTGGTVTADTKPACTVRVNGGTMRVKKTLTVNGGNGIVASVEYKDGTKDAARGYIADNAVSGGKVTLMVQTNKYGNAKTVTSVDINGTGYRTGKQNSGEYYRLYTIRYCVGEKMSEKVTQFTENDGTVKLRSASLAGYIFKGWSLTPDGADPVLELDAGENARDLVLTAVFVPEEGGNSDGRFPGGGNSGGGHYGWGGFSGVVNASDAEVGEEEDETEETGARDAGGSGTAPGSAPGTPAQGGGSNRRVSAATSKTKAGFENAAPKTENRDETVEKDPMEKTGPLAAGAACVVLAGLILVWAGRSGRKK